ncbi:MAG: PAS domain-containing protein [Halobacteriota archaeon]
MGSRQAEEDEQKYRTLVETASSIICTVDPAGIITFIYDYGARFFGYTREELGERTLWS